MSGLPQGALEQLLSPEGGQAAFDKAIADSQAQTQAATQVAKNSYNDAKRSAGPSRDDCFVATFMIHTWEYGRPGRSLFTMEYATRVASGENVGAGECDHQRPPWHGCRWGAIVHAYSSGPTCSGRNELRYGQPGEHHQQGKIADLAGQRASRRGSPGVLPLLLHPFTATVTPSRSGRITGWISFDW